MNELEQITIIDDVMEDKEQLITQLMDEYSDGILYLVIIHM